MNKITSWDRQGCAGLPYFLEGIPPPHTSKTVSLCEMEQGTCRAYVTSWWTPGIHFLVAMGDLGQDSWADISEILKPASASFSSWQTPNRDILVSSNIITIACVTTLRTKEPIISVSETFSK